MQNLTIRDEQPHSKDDVLHDYECNATDRYMYGCVIVRSAGFSIMIQIHRLQYSPYPFTFSRLTSHHYPNETNFHILTSDLSLLP